MMRSPPINGVILSEVLGLDQRKHVKHLTAYCLWRADPSFWNLREYSRMLSQNSDLCDLESPVHLRNFGVKAEFSDLFLSNLQGNRWFSGMDSTSTAWHRHCLPRIEPGAET